MDAVGAVLMVLITVSTMFSMAVTHTCFDPTDRASIEVVLNKPDITSDLSKLRELRNVVEVEPGRLLIYRSHIHEGIVVVLSLQRLTTDPSGPEYLAVRVESPLAQVNETVIKCGIDLVVNTLNHSISDLRKTCEELGWCTYLVEADDAVRGYLEKVVENSTVKIYLTPTKEGLELSVQAGSRAPEVVNEVNKLLSEAFNLSEVTISSSELKCFTVSVKKSLLVPAVGGEVLKKALTYELRWLTKIGVINGITEEDLNILSAMAEPGRAGWNGRLVYWGESWYPYSELVSKGLIKGGALLRGAGGCSWDYPESELPADPPESPAESRAPGNFLSVATALAVALAAAIAIVYTVFIKQSRSPGI